MRQFVCVKSCIYYWRVLRALLLGACVPGLEGSSALVQPHPANCWAEGFPGTQSVRLWPGQTSCPWGSALLPVWSCRTSTGWQGPDLLPLGASPTASSILVPMEPLAPAVHWQLLAISFPISPPLSGVLNESMTAMLHSTASTYINIHFVTWLWPCKMPFRRLIRICKASLALSPKPGIIPV